MVGILLVAYTLSFVDRTIIALMVEPIQRDLGISDTQFSLLHGFAFAIFYTFLGIPIAMLADRYSRRTIIATGIAVWSAATALCGLTRTYIGLFTARMGVGVGEAALSPAAYSMIADSFPPSKLGRALGIYQVGVFVGAGLAFLIGGVVIEFVMNTDQVILPMVGEVRSWQLVFIIVGMPGLLVSLWVLTLREPERRKSALSSSLAGGSLADLFSFLRGHRKLFITHFMGYSLAALVFNGFSAWIPAMFIRKYGLAQGDVGQVLGISLLVFGTLGIVTGGWVADHLTRRGHVDGTMKAALIGVMGMLPFAIIAPLPESWQMSLGLMSLFFFFSSFIYAGGAASLQLVTPNRLRAQVSSLYLFCINLLGIGVGPTAIALITDNVFEDQMMVDKSMALVGGGVSVLAVITLLISLRPFMACHAEANAHTENS
jgi:MFS family permease